MFILGLTGGIASGKTTATNFFASKGIEIIDADEISRGLQLKGEAGYKQVLKEFGKDILDDADEINRSALRKIAFANKTNKEKLEGIMHPLIRSEIIQGFENIKSNNKDSLEIIENLIININTRQFLHNANYAVRNSNYEVAAYIAITDLYESKKILDTIYKSLDEKIIGSKYGIQLKKIVE